MVVRLDHLLAISLGGVPEDVLLALLQLLLDNLLAEAGRVLRRWRSSIILLLLLLIILRLLEILHNDAAWRLLHIHVHWRKTHDGISYFLRTTYLVLRSYLLDVVV